MERDQTVNSQSQESSFFLMFGRDMYIPILGNILQPKLRYLGDTSSTLSLEMSGEAYMMAAINHKKARDNNEEKQKKMYLSLKLEI